MREIFLWPTYKLQPEFRSYSTLINSKVSSRLKVYHIIKLDFWWQKTWGRVTRAKTIQRILWNKAFSLGTTYWKFILNISICTLAFLHTGHSFNQNQRKAFSLILIAQSAKKKNLWNLLFVLLSTSIFVGSWVAVAGGNFFPTLWKKIIILL